MHESPAPASPPPTAPAAPPAPPQAPVSAPVQQQMVAPVEAPAPTAAPGYPTGPSKIEELPIPFNLAVDLFLRRAMLDGQASIASLSAKLGLHPRIIEAVFHELREKKYIDVKSLAGSDYSFELTSTGTEFAADRYRVCQYAGIAPVSLAEYCDMISSQRAKVVLNREYLKHIYADLVMPENLIDELGPAIMTQTSLFLYGPSGTGKTSLAERIGRVFSDLVLIPRVVEADGQIINVFDPAVHHMHDQQPPGLDPRWVVCRRPVVLVGGELTPDMIELRLDPNSKTYVAPLQMKANNGVFIIDDFGRQVMPAEDLLNRWIVPLERKIDFLTLGTGAKLMIPFDIIAVFSTNLGPEDLGEAAFRRITNKLYIGPVEDESFDWILARVLRSWNMTCDPGIPAYIRKVSRDKGDGHLKASLPKDVCMIVSAIAEFEGVPKTLTRELVDRAMSLYYAKTDGEGGLAAPAPGSLTT